MRKFMMTMAALAMSSGVAWGQGVATQTVTLNATVGGHCTFDGSPSTSRVSGVTITNARATDTDAFGNLGQLATVTCTSNSTISMSSSAGGLTNSSAAAAAAALGTAFVNKIHYTATAGYNSSSHIFDSSAQLAGTVTNLDTNNALSAGPLTLSIVTKATTPERLLFNGTYTDTLTVTVSPRA